MGASRPTARPGDIPAITLPARGSEFDERAIDPRGAGPASLSARPTHLPDRTLSTRTLTPAAASESPLDRRPPVRTPSLTGREPADLSPRLPDRESSPHATPTPHATPAPPPANGERAAPVPPGRGDSGRGGSSSTSPSAPGGRTGGPGRQ
jgi:hypothetical protein